MSTIRGMLRKVLEAKQGIEPTMLRIVNDNKEIIIDLNREKQLSLGLNPDGELIGVYSKATETMYGGAENGKFAGEPYNFEDTGDLFKGFKLEFNNGELRIYSTDSKVPLLQSEYGQLFGLTKNNEYTLNYDIIKAPLVKYIKQTIRG